MKISKHVMEDRPLELESFTDARLQRTQAQSIHPRQQPVNYLLDDVEDCLHQFWLACRDIGCLGK